MKIDEMKIKIGCETGLLARKLEVIREGLDIIINGLDKIDERYCECGGEFKEIDDLQGEWIGKECIKCGTKFVLRSNKN